MACPVSAASFFDLSSLSVYSELAAHTHTQALSTSPHTKTPSSVIPGRTDTNKQTQVFQHTNTPHKLRSHLVEQTTNKKNEAFHHAGGGCNSLNSINGMLSRAAAASLPAREGGGGLSQGRRPARVSRAVGSYLSHILSEGAWIF